MSIYKNLTLSKRALDIADYVDGARQAAQVSWGNSRVGDFGAFGCSLSAPVLAWTALDVLLMPSGGRSRHEPVCKAPLWNRWR